MMTKLLTFKDFLKQTYGKYTAYIDPALKLIVAILAMVIVNANIGYMSVLKNPAIVMIIALVCAFLPVGMILGVVILFMIAHIYALSLELSLIVAAVMVIMYVLYIRFTPTDGIIILIMPLLFFIKIPYIVPLVIGLIATPISAVSIAFGTIMYFVMYFIGKNAALITNSGDAELTKITAIFIDAFSDKEMYLFIVVFAITVLVVYVIRKRSLDHAWTIAIISGGVIDALAIIAGVIFLDIEAITPMHLMITGMIISVALAYVLQFFILAVDYSRTEYVQFEDDEYYYYVKAVPKVKVTTQDVQVKRINTRKANTDM